MGRISLANFLLIFACSTVWELVGVGFFIFIPQYESEHCQLRFDSSILGWLFVSMPIYTIFKAMQMYVYYYALEESVTAKRSRPQSYGTQTKSCQYEETQNLF